MGWKSKRNRPLSSSRSTSDILKALRWPGKDNHEIAEQEDEEQICIRQGYLHVQANDGFWFMMWVVIRGSDLEFYNEPFEHLPVEVVNLADTLLVIPPVIPSECPENIIYPLQIIKEDCPTNTVACLGAKNAEDQEDWANAIRCTLEACSLSIEGLDLQTGLPANKQTEASVADHATLMRKMELLEELLAQRDKCVGDQLPRDKKTMDLCQKLADADNYYDRVIISEQQDALRRATYLRQRKISTQLKADTIRKQLSKSTKRRSKPKSVPEDCEDSEFYEGQLQELTSKLKAIHNVLGKTEKESEVASRKLGRKYEHEMKRLHSDMDLGGTMRRLDQPQLTKTQKSTWSLSKSQEDCRTAHQKPDQNSLKNRNSAPLKTTSQNPLLATFQQRRRKTSEEEFNRLPNSLDQPSSSANKSRISPLRFLGNFVDNRLSRARNKSKKLTQQESDFNALSDDKPRAKTESYLDDIKPAIPDYSIWNNAHFQSPNLQRLEQEMLSSGSEGSARSSFGSDSVRTKIDPSALAEIEAFESMTQQFLHVGLN